MLQSHSSITLHSHKIDGRSEKVAWNIMTLLSHQKGFLSRIHHLTNLIKNTHHNNNGLLTHYRNPRWLLEPDLQTRNLMKKSMIRKKRDTCLRDELMHHNTLIIHGQQTIVILPGLYQIHRLPKQLRKKSIIRNAHGK